MHDGESVCMRKLKGNPDTFDIASFVSDLRLLRALPSSSQPLLLPEYVISVIILSVHDFIFNTDPPYLLLLLFFFFVSFPYFTNMFACRYDRNLHDPVEGALKVTFCYRSRRVVMRARFVRMEHVC